jgi:hypothetical protein
MIFKKEFCYVHCIISGYIHLVSLANSDVGPFDEVGLLPGKGREDGRLVSVDVAVVTGVVSCSGVVHRLLGSLHSSTGLLSSSPVKRKKNKLHKIEFSSD